MKLSNKQKRIISLTAAVWGFTLISTGTTMALAKKPEVKDDISLRVVEKRTESYKSNEIKPKDMSSEIDKPISVNIKDYLENPDDIDPKILRSLKLDTSAIKINEAGSYTYTITYKKKKFSATYTIKEKELPNVTLTLKSINLEVGSPLSTDVQTYVNEKLTDEVKKNTTIDLSAVNTSRSGNYQYSIKYKNNLYTGTITIYQPNTTKKQGTIKPKKETKPDDSNTDPTE